MIGEFELFSQMVQGYATQLPLFVLYFAGLALAIARYRRAPRAMLLIALGLGWLALERLVMIAVWVWLPHYLTVQQGLAYPSVRWVFVVLQLGQGLFATVGLALVVAGAFADRAAPAGYVEQTD